MAGLAVGVVGTGVMRPRILAPLRHRSLRLLVPGQLASNVGDACYAVALPWYVLAAHGGPALLGTVLVAYGVPRTGVMVIGGWASDKWGSLTVMLVTDVTRLLGTAAFAAEAALEPARAVFLIPVAVVMGAGEGLFLPASYAVLPSLVPNDDLRAANAITTSAAQLGALAGPAVGGALVALAGPSLVFALDAVSFAVSAATLQRLRAAPRVGPSVEVPAGDAAETTTAAESSMSTFALIRSQTVLKVILVLAVTANLGADGVYNVALPSLAHGALRSGADGYGLILAAVGAGTLLGAVVAGQVRQPRRPGVTAVLAFQVSAGCVFLAPHLGGTLGVAGAMAVDGLMTGFGNVLCFAAFQRWAPPAVLGRATGVLTLGIFGVYPLSVALAAICIRDIGTASFFLFAAIALTGAVVFGLSQRAWREFGMVRPVPEETCPDRGNQAGRALGSSS